MVGAEVDDTGHIRVDYEGDQEIFSTYEAHVARAAERYLHARSDGDRGYMTRACAYVDPEEVVEVGWWDPVASNLTDGDKFFTDVEMVQVHMGPPGSGSSTASVTPSTQLQRSTGARA